MMDNMRCEQTSDMREAECTRFGAERSKSRTESKISRCSSSVKSSNDAAKDLGQKSFKRLLVTTAISLLRAKRIKAEFVEGRAKVSGTASNSIQEILEIVATNHHEKLHMPSEELKKVVSRFHGEMDRFLKEDDEVVRFC